mmetsp:Transcript_7596/g.10333  ORF Transcript_7596/g.10333 Transcript_7596/m.10333 type:complete len:260 (-) Transcript_7596:190-969(-)|eukprot:CAMPEP_0185731842 /NCGR_PEP_ID=MMETSP1171-20130828/14067_1 /TAXON_ID=374046 /ORGANISM="Helicotheca tamensis, Strain CCMP826" /LENGTH=259 /DNA_ID=CAMNT_0028401189 /DNA_START=64 /DNA_END=843 /DNA_ORIENTATION=-
MPDDTAKESDKPSLASIRETVVIWDGILSARKESGDAEEHKLRWEGTVVACRDSPDATKVDAPKRGAFEKDVSSELRFDVSGSAKPASGQGEEECFRAELTDGPGYDVNDVVGKKDAKHKDDAHKLLLAHLCWRGNVRDQSDNLVIASGSCSAFGTFISVGWSRPGNRLTLARRYLHPNDDRATWDLKRIRDEVLAEVKIEGQVRIPPWQCPLMNSQLKKRHAPTQHSGAAPAKKCKLTADTNNTAKEQQSGAEPAQVS